MVGCKTNIGAADLTCTTPQVHVTFSVWYLLELKSDIKYVRTFSAILTMRNVEPEEDTPETLLGKDQLTLLEAALEDKPVPLYPFAEA
jgi:hypothetical protein